MGMKSHTLSLSPSAPAQLPLLSGPLARSLPPTRRGSGRTAAPSASSSLRAHSLLSTSFPSRRSQRRPSPHLDPLRLPCLPSAPPHTKRVPAATRAAAGSAKSLIPSHGFDYYDLLGLPPSASLADIKSSYRRLQKRCHPDVAGREDMAILLNEAYSALSNPTTRFMYDQLRVTWLRDDAFTGEPVYSTWHGSEEEESAVFVDEVSCIGCLKCAVIASKTFAVECKHGRARAVRQWADDEATINAAILSCPVSCIKWVERSKLAALEHVLSTMPRPLLYSLAVGGDGKRAPDVYSETDKFLRKRKQNEGEVEAARARREQSRGTFNAIRNWWTGASSSAAVGALVASPVLAEEAAETARAARRSRFPQDGGFVPEDLRPLHDAASRQRAEAEGGGGSFFNLRVGEDEEEYWNPASPWGFKTQTTPGRKAEQAQDTGTAHQGRTPDPSTPAPAAGAHSNKDSMAMPAAVDGEQGKSNATGTVDETVAVPQEKQEEKPQFIAVTDWPDYEEEVRELKIDRREAILGALPAFMAVAAGAYVWLAPQASDPQSQAAAVAALQASGSNFALPLDLIVSPGMRMALSMAAWYTTGAFLAQVVRICLDVVDSQKEAQKGKL